MAKYRNRNATIFEEENDKRYPVSTILDSADLNGKQTKELMILRLLDANNKEVGEDIYIKPETVISGL